MDLARYREGVLFTENKDYARIRARLETRPELRAALVFHLRRLAETAEALDAVKKAAIYGSAIEAPMPADEMTGAAPTLHVADDQLIRFLHGCLGMATEAGEICEALLAVIVDGNLPDVANVEEECGDIDYYQVLTLDSVRSALENALAKNNAKLVGKRYKDGYSNAAALERDLKGEREILEAKPSSVTRSRPNVLRRLVTLLTRGAAEK